MGHRTAGVTGTAGALVRSSWCSRGVQDLGSDCTGIDDRTDDRAGRRANRRAAEHLAARLVGIGGVWVTRGHGDKGITGTVRVGGALAAHRKTALPVHTLLEAHYTLPRANPDPTSPRWGGGSLWLHVDADNAPAVQLYSDRGYGVARVVQHVGGGLDWGWGRGLSGLATVAAAAGGLGRLLPASWRSTAGGVAQGQGQGQVSGWEGTGPALQEQQQQVEGQGQATVQPIALRRRRRRGREFVMRKALRPPGRRAGGGGGRQGEERGAAGALEGPGSAGTAGAEGVVEGPGVADGGSRIMGAAANGMDNSGEEADVGADADAGAGAGLGSGAAAEAGVVRSSGQRVYDWRR